MQLITSAVYRINYKHLLRSDLKFHKSIFHFSDNVKTLDFRTWKINFAYIFVGDILKSKIINSSWSINFFASLFSLNSLRNYLLKRGLLANFARNRTLNARSRQYISWWCNWKNIVRGIKLHEKGLVIIATQIFSSESFLLRTHIHLSLKSDVFISVQKDWIFATDFVQKLLKEKVFINQI